MLLMSRIVSGEHPPGQLPSYRELSEVYLVSLTTVQRALLVLQSKGYVVGVQGRGTYVAEHPPDASG